MPQPLAPRRRPENPVQAAIVDYLALVLPYAFTFAVPNGARRFEGGRAGNAVPGLKAGVPDLCVILNGGDCAFFLEVKPPERGKAPKRGLSVAQIAIHAELQARLIPVFTVTSIDDVRVALKELRLTTREIEWTTMQSNRPAA